MALRTAAMGLSPAKNLRAVSFRICWLSDNPNCIVMLLQYLRWSTNTFETRRNGGGRDCQNRRNCQRLREFKTLLLIVLIAKRQRGEVLLLSSRSIISPPFSPSLRVSRFWFCFRDDGDHGDPSSSLAVPAQSAQ